MMSMNVSIRQHLARIALIIALPVVAACGPEGAQPSPNGPELFDEYKPSDQAPGCYELKVPLGGENGQCYFFDANSQMETVGACADMVTVDFCASLGSRR